jgi:protein arginine kinase activator
MSCDACGAQDATVAYAEIVDGVLSTWRLCEECARTRGVGASLSSLAVPFAGVLTELLSDEAIGSDDGRACPECGQTYGGFRRSGRLGCGACYVAFREELTFLIRRIHGTTAHVGCVPSELASRCRTGREVRELRRRLAAAVRTEEYEAAAELRDRIAVLEGESAASSGPTAGAGSGPAPGELDVDCAGEDDA